MRFGFYSCLGFHLLLLDAFEKVSNIFSQNGGFQKMVSYLGKIRKQITKTKHIQGC